MGRVERDRELARKRSRKAKLKKLREKYAATSDSSVRAEIVEKVRRLSPFVNLDEDQD